MFLSDHKAIANKAWRQHDISDSAFTPSVNIPINTRNEWSLIEIPFIQLPDKPLDKQRRTFICDSDWYGNGYATALRKWYIVWETRAVRMIYTEMKWEIRFILSEFLWYLNYGISVGREKRSWVSKMNWLEKLKILSTRFINWKFWYFWQLDWYQRTSR